MTIIKRHRRIFYSIALALIMYLFLLFTGAQAEGCSPALPFSAIYLIGLLLLGAEKRISDTAFLFAAAIAAALVYARVCMLPFVTGDYEYGFKEWITSIRDKSTAWENIGNYNLPYMYILWLISGMSYSWLIALKAVSCLFDVLLAYYIMKCVGLFSDREHTLALAFCAALALPTVLLNGAYWGQCDVIFASLAVASAYYGLSGKGWLCIGFLTLGFLFKLQPLFLIAGLAALFFTKKLKPLCLLAFPAVYLAVQTPALFFGMDFFTALARPFTGISGMTYGRLVLNAPTLMVFFENASYDLFQPAAIFTAGAGALALIYYAFIKRKSLRDAGQYLLLMYLSVMLITWLLPSMHERYYIIADCLSLVLVFKDKKLWYLAFITCGGSLLSYLPYLTGQTPIAFPVLSLAFLLAVVLGFIELSRSLVRRSISEIGA